MEKSKPSRYLYLLGFKFFYAERGLDLSSCLHDDVVKSAPCIGKYINKSELCRQCPPRRVKYTSMNEIEKPTRFSSFMNVFLVLKTSIHKWVANITLQKVHYGVYICTYTVKNIEKNKTSHAFVYNSHS